MKPLFIFLGLTGVAGLLLLSNRKKSESEYPLMVAPSKIQGLGLFSVSFIPTGAKIYPAIQLLNQNPFFQITPFASKMNHSFNPNSKIVLEQNVYYQYAVKNILPGEEITSDYTLAPEFVNRNISGFVAV